MTLRTSIQAEQVHTDNQTVNERPIEQKKAVTFTIGMGNMKPNHKMFEWDVAEGMIRPATIVNQTAVIGRMKSYKDYIEFEEKPHCHYTPALNAQNAEKRFKIRFNIK